jgi:hypothetical protein
MKLGSAILLARVDGRLGGGMEDTLEGLRSGLSLEWVGLAPTPERAERLSGLSEGVDRDFD